MGDKGLFFKDNEKESTMFIVNHLEKKVLKKKSLIQLIIKNGYDVTVCSDIWFRYSRFNLWYGKW